MYKWKWKKLKMTHGKLKNRKLQKEFEKMKIDT